MTLQSKVDPLIETHVHDDKDLTRTISKDAHKDRSLDELTSMMLELGTDPYDPCTREVVCDFSLRTPLDRPTTSRR